ncbi:hypothetical protein NW759_016522 [Fusarium solani]|nr:hypothetical protein NW759_016522 [Fusarium solani]
MEPPSFALAICGIPGIFKSAVDCFQYIQLGRNFGKDYGFCLAKLEAAELQFTRWGQATGFLQEPVDIDSLFQRGPWNEADIKKVRKWLGLINDAFQDAKNRSERYKLSVEDDEPELLEIPDQGGELDKAGPPTKHLVLSMRQVTKNRQKRLSMGKKIGWALFRKADFEALVETICRLIDNLVNIFPAHYNSQKELCQQEVKSLQAESIPKLVEVLGTNDKLLNLALSEEIQSRGHDFKDVWIDTSGFVRLGDTYENVSNPKPSGMAFTNLHITGSGTTHAGHHITNST